MNNRIMQIPPVIVNYSYSPDKTDCGINVNLQKIKVCYNNYNK